MALELLDLSHRFGRALALDSVTLRVERGDCFGFLGHNGAGKTTAMRIALGLLRPQRGRVRVDGSTAPLLARCRSSGLIEQPGFFRELSGAANLVRLARLAGMDRRAARLEGARVLELVELAGAAGQRVGGYSQGMRQRLGLAQALLGSPAYVLLDEPMNGLDPEGIAAVRKLLRQLAADARSTFLLSSHQLHEVEGLCNRIAILRQGRLVLYGDTAALLQREQRGRHRVRVDGAGAVPWQSLGLEAAATGTDGSFLVELGARDPADVLQALVAKGARVREFAPLPLTLEAIYLDASRQEMVAPLPAEPATVPAPTAPAEVPAASTAFGRVLRYELSRLARWPTVLVLLAPAFAVLSVLRRQAAVARDLEQVQARTLFSATDTSGYDALGLGLLAATPILLVAALGLASQTLAGELAQGTLRNLLLRPNGRGAVLLGKLAGVLAVVLAGFAATVCCASVAVWTTTGFRSAVEVSRDGRRTVLIDAVDLAPQVWPAVVSALPGLCCYVALGLCASALARRGATALGLALAVGAALDVGRGLVPEHWLPSAHLPSPLRDTSTLRAFTDLALGRADALFPPPLQAWTVCALWTAAAVVLAWAWFRRRMVP